MVERRSRWRPWLTGATIFLATTMLGVLQASQIVLYYRFEGKSIPWLPNLIRGVADWYCWAAFAPLIYELTRKAPFMAGTWRRSLALHAPVCLLLAFLIVAAMVPVFQATQWEPYRHRSADDIFRLLLATHFVLYICVYWGIVGTSQSLALYRRYQERELHTSQLETRLVEAQLQMLKMQLHPHFLFNTLNAIAALMHRDVELADKMLARLALLLRRALDSARAQVVTLQEELDFVKPYLEIEAARIGPRLKVRWDIDPEALEARVPNLLLQPIVENAVIHGIAPHPEAGRLEITAAVRNRRLHLRVADDGPGMDVGSSSKLHLGVGLSNTRVRLQQMYGKDQTMTYGDGLDGGFVVDIEIPLHLPGESQAELALPTPNVTRDSSVPVLHRATAATT